MNCKKRYKIVFSILCVAAFLTFPISTLAQGATTNGGEVSTKGKITFYEEAQSSESSSSETPQSTSTEESTTQESLPATGGKLPKTGESVRNFSLIGGCLLLIGILILFFKKRKKEGDHGS